MDPIDMDILFDLMKQNRPATIEEKDLDCNEFPHKQLITPFATEKNTGPSYNTYMNPSGIEQFPNFDGLISLSPNPADDRLKITINSQRDLNIKLDMYSNNGSQVKTIQDTIVQPGETTIFEDVHNLSSGIYSIIATIKGRKVYAVKFIKM